ncbi:MAG: hypothetical protein EAZ09_03630 [Oscillatoriales cyanobacterium]|nr:MAG: hypothetical protein EAZ09_03630 [Oscillatoriales cyanobacterium]
MGIGNWELGIGNWELSNLRAVGAGFTNNLCPKLTISKTRPGHSQPSTVNSEQSTIKTILADRAKFPPVFPLPPNHPAPPEPQPGQLFPQTSD